MEVDPLRLGAHGAAAMMGGQNSELGREGEVKSAIVEEEGVRWWCVVVCGGGGTTSSRHCQPL